MRRATSIAPRQVRREILSAADVSIQTEMEEAQNEKATNERPKKQTLGKQLCRGSQVVTSMCPSLGTPISLLAHPEAAIIHV
jgi:hypothetical protein